MVDDVFDPLAADRGGRGTEGRIEEYPLGVIVASVRVLEYGADLHGWCISETAGAAARCRIRDGRGLDGTVIAAIALAANTTSAVYFGETGIEADTGLYLEVVAGSVEVVLYVKAPGTNRRQ